MLELLYHQKLQMFSKKNRLTNITLQNLTDFEKRVYRQIS